MPGRARGMARVSESVVHPVGVVDRGGDADVGAGHHGGDGEHRRSDEVDVRRHRLGSPGPSATLRKTWLNKMSIAIGIVSENISSCGTRAVVRRLRIDERRQLGGARRGLIAIESSEMVLGARVVVAVIVSSLHREMGEDVVEGRRRDVDVVDRDAVDSEAGDELRRPRRHRRWRRPTRLMPGGGRLRLVGTSRDPVEVVGRRRWR